MVPLKEVVLNTIETTIRIDAIKPIISILFNLKKLMERDFFNSHKFCSTVKNIKN